MPKLTLQWVKRLGRESSLGEVLQGISLKWTRWTKNLRAFTPGSVNADMKVKIFTAKKPSDIFYYPDVMVTCDPQDTEKYYKTAPCLIIEVLSPSTEDIDRREKRLNYQSLPSLQEHVLVYQTEMKVEVYRLNDEGYWLKKLLGKDDILELSSVGLTLTMADIYDEVIAF